MIQASMPASTSQTGLVQYRRFAVNLFFYVLMTAIAIVFLTPLIWMVMSSFKPESEVMRIPPSLLPSRFQWENYAEVGRVIPYFVLNSLKLAALSVGGVLVVSSMAGYAFARLEFWGRDFAFSVLLSTLMVPSIVTLIPLYIIYKNIGWIDTHYPL